MPRNPKPKKPSHNRLPSKQEILDFIASADGKVGKREIKRAFSIKGGANIALKRLLGEMADEGLLAGNRRELRHKGDLPPVTVLDVVRLSDDGELIAEPAVWDNTEAAKPKVLLLNDTRRQRASDKSIGVGDRVLARITKLDEADIAGCHYEATPIKRLPKDRRRLLGIFRKPAKHSGTIEPIDRKALRSWRVQKGEGSGAKDGDLVAFELPRKGRMAVTHARITQVLGNPDDQRQISLIAVHAHGLPDTFPDSVSAQAEDLKAATLNGRTDLRDMPLITIDPADARDHDDAVYAEPDDDPKNIGGFIITVAIADVAHYVRPGSELDREAEKRANSVYFPDRVVPMLPERISNDLCSLRENENRACMAVQLVFDKTGTKKKQTFVRALMRSAAKLSYEEAQAAIDGKPTKKSQPLLEPILKPLWAAYAVLRSAREKRSPLDLDLPERRIVLDPNGRVEKVVVPERLDAHKLIEEFMIQANVAAAEVLEQKNAQLVYRVHDQPSKEKLKALREFLETLKLKLPPQGALKPAALNRVLSQAKKLPVADLVNEVVLRSQAQAEYTLVNGGHFGLNLARYAHFTSPIRRYADLIVHRALIRALNLGEDGLTDAELPRLGHIAKSISEAERRAMAAERETTDRLIAAHLEDRVGAEFEARIAGVTKSGLFVRLAETGADGFVPVSTLGDDFYIHVEEAHALVGQRTNLAYRLGDIVTVRLVEAIATAGALRFEMLTPGKKGHVAPIKGLKGRRSPRRRAPPRRR